MRIVPARFEIMPRDEDRGGMAMIERAARTCYKSEDRIGDGTAESLVKALITRKHEAMLEHGDMIFQVDDSHILDCIDDELQGFRRNGQRAPMLKTTRENKRYIISGNMRAWRELIASDCLALFYFLGHIDPIYFQDMIHDQNYIADTRIHPIKSEDLRGPTEQRAHLRESVRFTIDRGVSHEFVRHRVMSFAMESTRYCNYSQDKFGREITVIEPCFLEKDSEGYDLWKRQCMSAEVAYFHLLSFGLLPQEARTVLPHSVKTELVMTGTLGQWDHFFDLRARQSTGPAHPQAVEVAKPLMMQMAAKHPTAFGAEWENVF